MHLVSRFLVCGAAVLTLASVTGVAIAQGKPLPTGPVVIFPAVVDGTSDNSKSVSDTITEALKARLRVLGSSVLVYSSKIPSMLRAREEQLFRKEAIDAGPGDDRDMAKKMAINIGATEFVQVFVDSYKYDSGTRTASFNLNVNRYVTATGAPIGTVVNKQQGIADATTPANAQETLAVSRAMAVGAQQSIGGLYSGSVILETAKVPKKGKRRSNNWVTPLFVGLLGGLYKATR